jgi:hypothetical protein
MRGRMRGRVRTAIVALGLIGTLAGPAQAADPPRRDMRDRRQLEQSFLNFRR